MSDGWQVREVPWPHGQRLTGAGGCTVPALFFEFAMFLMAR